MSEQKEAAKQPEACESSIKNLPASVLASIQESCYILSFRGRQKVESLNFLASSKSDAIEQSKNFCTERKLRWLAVSPMFSNVTEKVKVPIET